MNPFIQRASIVNNQIRFDTSKLDGSQKQFVLAFAREMNAKGLTIDQDTHLAYAFWLNNTDFAGGVLGPFVEGHTPDTQWNEHVAKFNSAIVDSSTRAVRKATNQRPNSQLQHKLRPSQSDPRNLPWFDQMWSLTSDGGTLATSHGSYKKTATGFVPA